MLKRILSIAVCFAVLFCVSAVNLPESSVTASASSAYSGPYVQVGDVTLPLEEYMPGTFFTKNGQACTNHATADCIANGSDCNCMRYYPTGNPATCEIDLLAVQCYGFSRLVFYKCFGFLDHPTNSSRYHSVGYILNGYVTADSVKNLLMQAAPGAHVRLTRGHSVSILAMDEEYLTVYHGNSGGDGVTSAPCVVSTLKYTWEEFAQYARAGIDFVNMPNEYPGWEATERVYYTGNYVTTEFLNLRAEANTNCEVYITIPVDTQIEVTEVNGEWGKTNYGGYNGWVNLYYARFETVSYITTDYLNLRAEQNTSCQIYITIPVNTVIEISTINNGWGKTNYGGFGGWVSMDYVKLYAPQEEPDTPTKEPDTSVDPDVPENPDTPVTSYDTLTPTDDTFVLDPNGSLRTISWKMTVEEFKSHFQGQEILITDKDGVILKDNHILNTGSIAQLIKEDGIIHQAVICFGGDSSGDGKVTAADYLATKRIIFGYYNADSPILTAADVNSDGKLTMADYLIIQKYCFNSDSSGFGKFMTAPIIQASGEGEA